MSRRFSTYPWLVTLMLVLGSCQSSPDEDLVQANAAMASMGQNRTLAKSCFRVAYPNGNATDFVRYLFSDLGSAEWPIALDQLEAEQMKAIKQKVIPPTVTVSANQRQYLDRKELVLEAIEGKIQARGYLPQETKPTLEDEWGLGTASVEPNVISLCQSNIEMGIGIGQEEQPGVTK